MPRLFEGVGLAVVRLLRPGGRRRDLRHGGVPHRGAGAGAGAGLAHPQPLERTKGAGERGGGSGRGSATRLRGLV